MALWPLLWATIHQLDIVLNNFSFKWQILKNQLKHLQHLLHFFKWCLMTFVSNDNVPIHIVSNDIGPNDIIPNVFRPNDFCTKWHFAKWNLTKWHCKKWHWSKWNCTKWHFINCHCTKWHFFVFHLLKNKHLCRTTSYHMTSHQFTSNQMKIY